MLGVVNNYGVNLHSSKFPADRFYLEPLRPQLHSLLTELGGLRCFLFISGRPFQLVRREVLLRRKNAEDHLYLTSGFTLGL